MKSTATQSSEIPAITRIPVIEQLTEAQRLSEPLSHHTLWLEINMKTIFAFIVALFTSASVLAIDFQEFTEQADFKYGVISNFEDDGKFSAFFEINNLSSVDLKASNKSWTMYIHYVRRITDTKSDQVNIERVQGDLYKITPTKDFAGLAPGEKIRVEFEARGHIATYSYIVPNAFMVDDNGNSYVFASTHTSNPADYTYPLVKPEQYLRFDQPARDNFSVFDAEKRYELNKANPLNKSQTHIVPTPREVHSSRGEASIDADWSVYQAGGLGFEARYLVRSLEFLGVVLPIENNESGDKKIRLIIDGKITEESGYELNVKNNNIDIRAADTTGIFYGVQSLLSLVPFTEQSSSIKIPAVRVFDSPRYSWRGMHYDIARNFHGKDTILTLVEQMGRYKLNKLHLHVTDDEGWRIQIPGLEELTEVGSNRCFDLKENSCLLTQLGSGPDKDNPGSGYLSVDDYIEIVRFANDRHIEVIPEIDMPGHSRAAVVAMKARYRKLKQQGKDEAAAEFLLSDPNDKSEYLTVQSYSDNSVNVCMESSYRFIEKVVYELQTMHRKAGTKLSVFHMGGDEVGKGSWEKSPICNALINSEANGVAGVDDLKPYFVKRVGDITAERGLSLVGWEDGLMYDKNNPFPRDNIANKQVIANAWDNIWEYGIADRAYVLANAGYDVVLSSATHLYFDHPHQPNPYEDGYHWAARYTDLKKVFSFMPGDLYANARMTFTGNPIENLDKLVDKVHVGLDNPERILGLQGQLWTEVVRSQSQMEAMVFPRLLALAERAWHKAAWESEEDDNSFAGDWEGFVSSLVFKELPKLSRMGVNFYLPPPGLKKISGQVFINTELPGLEVESSIDGGQHWNKVTKSSVEFDSRALFRSRLGDQTSRATGLSLSL